MLRLLPIALLLIISNCGPAPDRGSSGAAHPSLLITKAEALDIRQALGKYPLLDKSFAATSAVVENALSNPIDVPPPGESGSYEHERHKQNYREMRDAGLLFQITGEEKYAGFIRAMLIEYAAMYPDLGPHPQAHNQKPGKLFHQMLNDAVWLTNTAIAFDCIYDWLTPDDRNLIMTNVFEPMVAWFTGKNAHEFDRIHNHGMWAAASVGMIGYVVGNRDWVDMALYGTKKDSTGGFLKQVELLFSPDGYYMEGPYYVRYAMRPLFKFAEAIERNQPELDIYNFQDGILGKAVYAAANTAFPNGVFAPINDASKTMNIQAIGMLLGTNSVIYRSGADENLLALCDVQGRVFLNGAGLATARAYAALDAPPKIKWSSIEYTDGAEGNEGGLGILRSGVGADQSVALMKYGVHGLGHGHFDKLQIIFYDQGKEIIPDYGFCRWINIETKYGGRYLPENNSYAKQTIAHNTVVIDGKSQNDGNRKAADLVHGERHFFNADDPGVQVMSARANDHYAGVEMQRTVIMLANKGTDYPALVDIYRIKSDAQHRYDYPIHYTGQITDSNLKFTVNTANQVPLGAGYGYQHIWNTAEASIDSSLQFSWVDGHRYYTVTTADIVGGKAILGRIGANDPNHNLRSEPLVIVRATGDEFVFVSVIEPHGYFDEATESSRKARGDIQKVQLLGSSDDGTVVEITGKHGLHWTIAINNGIASATDQHAVDVGGTTFEWQGNFTVEF